MGQAQFVCGSNAGMTALGTLGVGDLKRMLLDGLVNGGATQSVSSLTVTGGVATLTMSSDPTWFKGQIATISGVSGGPTGFAGLNKTTRLLSKSGAVFTFDATGVSNGTATGTILAKIAACGAHAGQPWQEQFTGTNTTSLRAQAGLRLSLMVNDNANTNTGIVRGFRTMSAVTTGVGPFPTATQSDTNLKWPRPDPTSMTSVDWIVYGDEKRFLAGINAYSDGYRVWCGFGDLPITNKSGDAYHCYMLGAANAVGDDSQSPINGLTTGSPNYGGGQSTDAFYTTGLALARQQNQSTDSLICSLLNGFGASAQPYVSAFIGSAPAVGTSSPISGGIELCFVDVLEYISASSAYYRRGRFPMLGSWNQPDFANNDKTVYSGVGDFGDIVIFKGDVGQGPAGGIILPLSDLDTAFAQ